MDNKCECDCFVFGKFVFCGKTKREEKSGERERRIKFELSRAEVLKSGETTIENNSENWEGRRNCGEKIKV